MAEALLKGMQPAQLLRLELQIPPRAGEGADGGGLAKGGALGVLGGAVDSLTGRMAHVAYLDDAALMDLVLVTLEGAGVFRV
jgi:hypothetical protein